MRNEKWEYSISISHFSFLISHFSFLNVMDEERIYINFRIILGLVFLLASGEKILDPEAFARVVENYSILPSFLVNPVTLILPWIGAVCGFFLVTGYLVKGCSLIVDILMIIFILAFIININRGIDISCCYFSNPLTTKKTEYLFIILRDVLILGMGLWIFFYKIKTDTLVNRKLNNVRL